MANLYDKHGREIMIGDVLKVFHFTAALRRKKHFMYKHVVGFRVFRDGSTGINVSHLDLKDDCYVIVCDGSHLSDHEIVQSIDCRFDQRPRQMLANVEAVSHD